MKMLSVVVLGLLVGVSACDKLPGQKKAQEAGTARGMPDFGGVTVVDVEADGVGPTRNAALLDALNLAVQQTNGSPIVGVTENANGSLALLGKSGDFGVTLSNVASVTRGAVKSFEIVSEKQQAKGWRVGVKAKVAKFKDPAASAMPKVAIAPARTNGGTYLIGDQALSSQAAANGVRQAAADAIGQSNRFFVINRAFDDELEAEAANITSDQTDPAELAKLGKRLTADILILPEIRRLSYRKTSRTLRYSGRELRSYAGGAEIAFNVLNVATGQLILSKAYTVQFPDTPPTIHRAQAIDDGGVQVLLASLAEQFTREFVAKNFPVSVVKMDGATVTLSQGEAVLRAGETYDVVSLGEEIRDPQTGQSLGRSEAPVGVITITRTAEKFSVGSFRGSFDASRFTPGVLELRSAPTSSAIAAPVATTTPEAATVAAPGKAQKSAATRAPRRKATDEFNKDFGF